MAGGWRTPPSAFSKQIRKDLTFQMRFLALSILRSLVTISPVDTGRFVNNWVVGVSTKNTSTILDTDPNRRQALSRGDKVLKQHTGLKEIWISNNLPYGQRLNEGWSQKAPANFVQVAVQRAVTQAKRLN